MSNARIIKFSYFPLYFLTIRFQIPYNQKIKKIEMQNDYIACIKLPWPKAHKLAPKLTSIVSMEP
jgi:hypothetical protein